MHGSVLATLPRAILAYLAARGHDADAVARAVGLAPESWLDAEARVPRERVDALWDRAVAETGDGALGVRVALAMPPGSAGVLETACQTAPTARVGLERLCRYWHLLNDGVDLVLADVADTVELRLHTRSCRPLARAWIDLTVMALTVIGARALPRPRPPVEVRLPYPEDRHAAELASWVGAPLSFAAPWLAIAYPADALAQPLIAADPALHRLAVAHADERLSARGEDVVAQVRQAVHARLLDGELTVEGVARALGMSSRTLQRRLAGRGLSLRRVIDEARRAMALSEVERGGRPLVDIAFAVGFSEASAFDRAFKRWTGTTPTAYRAAARAPGG